MSWVRDAAWIVIESLGTFLRILGIVLLYTLVIGLCVFGLDA